jgi:ribosome-associated protein
MASHTRGAHRQPQLRDIEFTLRSEYIALNDLLKATGAVASGGAGKALVAAGMVTVDGHPETRKTCKIRAGQRVETPELRIRVGAAPPP